MKTSLRLIILTALFLSSAPAGEVSDEVYNAAGKQLTEQVKAALTELSKKVPCLVGIETAKIWGPERGVNHSIYFTKDTHQVKAAQGSPDVPNEDGIVFAIGLSEFGIMLKRTKTLILRKQGYANQVEFYYSVETGKPEAKNLIVAELEKISAPILQSLTEMPK